MKCGKWDFSLLANTGGRAVEGLEGTSDATFSMADEVFVAICLGQLNPQVAFLQGKMKIRGSMAKATKFTPDLFPTISADMLSLDANEAVDQFLKSVAPSESASAASTKDELSPEASKLKSAQLYPLMKQHLASPAGAALVKQVRVPLGNRNLLGVFGVNSVYRVDLVPVGGGPTSTLYIDLKKMPPTIREAPSTSTDPFDCCFIIRDDVFLKIATGKLNPQFAFLQGKMKIKGSTQAAMKFTRDMFPKVSRL